MSELRLSVGDNKSAGDTQKDTRPTSVSVAAPLDSRNPTTDTIFSDAIKIAPDDEIDTAIPGDTQKKDISPVIVSSVTPLDSVSSVTPLASRNPETETVVSVEIAPDDEDDNTIPLRQVRSFVRPLGRRVG
jgi:hypothetical protein